MKGLLDVTEETNWGPDESAAFNDPLLDNFAHYISSSTDQTVLTLAKVRRDGELVGVAPVIRLVRYRATRLLKENARWWMDPLFGPFACKTTCLIDTSLMAFRYADPFVVRKQVDLPLIRAAVIEHLQAAEAVDTIIVSGPYEEGAHVGIPGFTSFLQLPLAFVNVAGCTSFDDYLQRLSKKRRKNVRQERSLFAAAGGRIVSVQPPYDADLITQLHAQLMASAKRNEMLEVPYGDVMNAKDAFERQSPPMLLAMVGEEIAGFFAFVTCGDTMHQCHGGLNYARSAEIKAYPNLMHAAVDYAISNGLNMITLGPLNNEAKRRVSDLRPVAASFWCRDAVSRFFMKNIMMERFQVYTGKIAA